MDGPTTMVAAATPSLPSVLAEDHAAQCMLGHAGPSEPTRVWRFQLAEADRGSELTVAPGSGDQFLSGRCAPVGTDRWSVTDDRRWRSAV